MIDMVLANEIAYQLWCFVLRSFGLLGFYQELCQIFFLDGGIVWGNAHLILEFDTVMFDMVHLEGTQ